MNQRQEKKRAERIVVTVLAVILLVSGTGTALAFGAPSDQNKETQNMRRTAYLREDITVELNREKLSFFDEKGSLVYPITYNGSTYLPIRAVSGLMGEPIEWNHAAKTVYVGRTLSQPVKYFIDPKESPYVRVVSDNASGGMSSVVVREQRDIFVMYDFETKQFRNEAGTVIYPINYNGSNYLPLRAVSGLMGEEIVWDGKTKTVYIGSMKPIEETEVPEIRKETLDIIELYDQEAEVYNLATVKISNVGKWTREEAPLRAASISEDLKKAKEYKEKAASLLKTETFTEEEFSACGKLYDFIETTEYYILVMENIAYMAAEGQDYSMLAETFLNFALESGRTMEAAREAIECL